VLGTAGHIDHGKTALIRALTGTDTDRLPEEKSRGITIELGFASLDLGDGTRLSVVDVPGHEGLVRTMVSGATGIDLLLLVVAADEGVMPQTREHVAICDLLGLERAIVALTKCDLVDEEMCELASEEVADLLVGTALEGAPRIAVSSTEGTGLDTLRAELAALAHSSGPRTSRRGVPRLGIDRAFAMKGFGAVVTGTLVGSELQVGDNVEILPSGKSARIRGLQSFGEARERVAPGFRCAVNLQGVEVGELSRGDVLTRARSMQPSETLDVRIDWLKGAPAIGDSASIELLVGTAERRARLAAIGPGAIGPGERRFARLHIDEAPLPVLPGDRFVARGFAKTEQAGATLGGGIVVDIAPPHRRRSDPRLEAELAVLAGLEPTSGARARIERAGFAGSTREKLALETGFETEVLARALDELQTSGVVAGREGGPLVACETLGRLESQLRSALDAFHDEKPLQPGMPRAALLGTLPENVPPAVAELALERLQESGALETDAKLVRRPGRSPALDDATRELTAAIAREALEAGLEAPAPRDWAARLGISDERFRDLVAHLEREGTLVRAPGDLWFHVAAVDTLRERVVAFFATHDELDTPSYKELIGTSRRSAVPLMELFDEERLTRRAGNARVLRGGRSGSPLR